jgi:NAD(P)H-flavin reductase
LADPSEPDLTHTAVLTGRRDAGAGLRLVTLAPPPALAPSYRAPGQYIEVHTGPGGFFVLASAVGASSWELLVRNVGGASDVLTNALEGTRFSVTGPLGEGFPIERARGRSLVVAVVGSALAVARPILSQRIAQLSSAPTSIYLGVTSAREVPLPDEVEAWGEAGVRIVLCVSRPELDDPGRLPAVTRKVGWVQKVLAADVARGAASGLVFAAGPPAMLEEVRGVAGASDVTLEVVTNV